MSQRSDAPTAPPTSNRAAVLVEPDRVRLFADFRYAEEDLANIRASANEEKITIARYEVENTALRVAELEAKLERSDIHAPFSGIVILPNARPAQDLKAPAGDEAALATVERCLDHELGWFATQEIGDLVEE